MSAVLESVAQSKVVEKYLKADPLGGSLVARCDMSFGIGLHILVHISGAGRVCSRVVRRPKVEVYTRSHFVQFSRDFIHETLRMGSKGCQHHYNQRRDGNIDNIALMYGVNPHDLYKLLSTYFQSKKQRRISTFCNCTNLGTTPEQGFQDRNSAGDA